METSLLALSQQVKVSLDEKILYSTPNKFVTILTSFDFCDNIIFIIEVYFSVDKTFIMYFFWHGGKIYHNSFANQQ